MWLANESLVTQLQARVRGYLFRKKHAERMAYLHQQEPHAVKLQVLYYSSQNNNLCQRFSHLERRLIQLYTSAALNLLIMYIE